MTNGWNPWEPETDKYRLAVLGKLAEEASELATAAARCIIQGIDESEPVTGKPNREWLEDEIADVLANIYRVRNAFGLNGQRIIERSDNKCTYIKEWQESLVG